jgi:hypothetical protein
MKHPHESRVQTILTAQEARRRKPRRRDGVSLGGFAGRAVAHCLFPITR